MWVCKPKVMSYKIDLALLRDQSKDLWKDWDSMMMVLPHYSRLAELPKKQCFVRLLLGGHLTTYKFYVWAIWELFVTGKFEQPVRIIHNLWNAISFYFKCNGFLVCHFLVLRQISLRNICVIIQTAKDDFLRPCEEYAAVQLEKEIFRWDFIKLSCNCNIAAKFSGFLLYSFLQYHLFFSLSVSAFHGLKSCFCNQLFVFVIDFL